MINKTTKGARKKNAFLIGHSTNTWPPIPVSRTKAIFFCIYRHIYVFEYSNSDMGNGFKKIENVPENNSCTAETGTRNRRFLIGTRIIGP